MCLPYTNLPVSDRNLEGTCLWAYCTVAKACTLMLCINTYSFLPNGRWSSEDLVELGESQSIFKPLSVKSKSAKTQGHLQSPIYVWHYQALRDS